jgi:2'-5' RNA ligase
MMLNEETAREFNGIPLPKGATPEVHKHVTLFYIPKEDETLKSFYTAVEILRRVIIAEPAPTLWAKGVSKFPKGDDGIPVICPVHSVELLGLRARIAALFDLNGVKYSKKFDYNPHVTLGYSPVEPTAQAFAVPVIWVPSSVTHFYSSSSEENDEDLRVEVPFRQI